MDSQKNKEGYQCEKFGWKRKDVREEVKERLSESVNSLGNKKINKLERKKKIKTRNQKINSTVLGPCWVCSRVWLEKAKKEKRDKRKTTISSTEEAG